MSRKLFSLVSVLTSMFLFSPLSARADVWGDLLDPSVRFTVLASFNYDAVLDNETGLIWERAPAPPSQLFIQSGATYTCNNLIVGNNGRKGWRLPTVQELGSLVDTNQASPTLPLGHPFVNVDGGFFWSATVDANSPANAWGLQFSNGAAYGYPSSAFERRWCVRGGQGVDLQGS